MDILSNRTDDDQTTKSDGAENDTATPSDPELPELPVTYLETAYEGVLIT